MDDAVLPDQLFSLLSSAALEVSRFQQVKVLTHYDADGISSAGILANVLHRKGIKFHLTMVKSLDDRTVESFGADAQCLILADMGASNLPALEKLRAKVIVLDHHRPVGDSPTLIHINPHLFGIDGMTGGCAGAVCMMFAVAMDERNWDLLPVAFAGIVGDRQHIRGLSGLNRYLLDEGLKRGLMELRPGSILPSGKLLDGLADCVDPYIIGISGDREGALALLKEAGIKEDAELERLPENERRELSSLLTLMLLKQGCTSSSLEEVIADRYYFPSWNMLAEDLAQLLNACGRTDQEGVGVGVAMHDWKSIGVAEGLRRQYKDAILAGMKDVLQKGVTNLQNIQYFYSPNPSLSGVLAGLTMQFVGDCDKPTITISFAGPKTRVSSRASFKFLEKGVDLAFGLREAAAAVNGTGGGHAVASGATIPRDKEQEFLSRLDEIIGQQKAKKASAPTV